MAAASDELEAIVRRSDPDRWLSSRFIGDEAQRADVIALYALDHELDHVVRVAREPLMAEIRLTWWREAIDEILSGRPPRGHPVLDALAVAVERRSLARAPLEALVEARFQDLESPRFEDADVLDNHIDATSGAVMALAVAILARVDAIETRPAAQAWALAGLLRQRRVAGVDRFPVGWDAAEPVARAHQALIEARAKVADLPVAAFPAVAHVALAWPYLAGRNPPGLEKRLRITWAVLSGRV